MTLSIFSSNRVESLQQNLCSSLSQTTLTNPLACETIVVPTYAMGRWLNLQIAQQQGIAANFDYPLPSTWVWQLAASHVEQLPEQDPLQHEYSSWKIFALLPGMLQRPAFASLQHYLLEDHAGIKRWQLATRIADVFERYQQYRPELILAWSAGADDNWQALLWRALIVDHVQTHRVVVIQQLISCLNSNVKTSLLPERVSLFAHSSLSPLFIQVIRALSQHIDVSLYQHSPTDHYWADLKNKKSMSKLRLERPSEAEYFETGNDLLASWGRQGQALQDLLLQNTDLPFYATENYLPPAGSSLLESIQQTIFELDNTATNLHADSSLSIHVCHSAMRECQVLKDSLLDMLDRDPSLNGEDMLVMIPEISRYAPYIEAVFGGSENSGQQSLRWNLSDITLADEHPLVLTFLQLLKLPVSRFSRSEVLSYLDIDEICQRFDIDDAARVEIISILQESRVRWGINESHKTSLGLPATHENTWQQAKQRIFAGYALGEIEFWNGISPIAIVDANRAQSMGKFWLLFERLEYWRNLLNTPCNSDEWQIRLNRLLDDLFIEKSQQDSRVQVIRDVINDLNLAQNVQMSPELLFHWMEQRLSSREIQGRLFSGGITFCGMRPMRCLPFRVICLLGLNDDVYPRRENKIEFDTMLDAWRPGDPTKGDEDRYLMLETLLCARQALYLSYSGRSLKDNSECQPSVLVRELLDFIDDRNGHDVASQARFSDSLTTIHSMQAFAVNNYLPDTASYDDYWCQIAKRIHQSNTAPEAQAWSTRTIACNPDEDRNINLGELQHFLQNPIKYFFNRRLRLWLRSHQEEENDEVFTLDPLVKWGIKQSIANDLLRGQKTSPVELLAQGRLPHGPAAFASFETLQSELEPLLIVLQAYSDTPPMAHEIDCQLDKNLRLSGQVGNYYPGKGLLHYSSSSLKGKHLLSLWLDHLALCASEQYQDDDSSLLITRDAHQHYALLSAQDARDQLRDYCELYFLGLNYPLPIFPLASYAWAKKDDPEKAMKAARLSWYGNEFQNIPGDKDNAYVKLALRGSIAEPLVIDAFSTLAQRLYVNALSNASDAGLL